MLLEHNQNENWKKNEIQEASIDINFEKIFPVKNLRY